MMIAKSNELLQRYHVGAKQLLVIKKPVKMTKQIQKILLILMKRKRVDKQLKQNLITQKQSKRLLVKELARKVLLVMKQQFMLSKRKVILMQMLTLLINQIPKNITSLNGKAGHTFTTRGNQKKVF